MNSPFGEVFLFLTDLAWKNRITIPMLVTTVFLIMDIRLQIEINIQSGQVEAAELDDMDDTDDDDDDNDGEDDVDDDDEDDESDEEYTTDGTTDDDETSLFFFQVESTRGNGNQSATGHRNPITSI